MKIVSDLQDTDVITFSRAEQIVEQRINKNCGTYFYIVKYHGDVVSFSGQYYKIAWNYIGDVRRALSLRFGRELADALIENGILEIERVYV